jgi:hypothetical protein
MMRPQAQAAAAPPLPLIELHCELDTSMAPPLSSASSVASSAAEGRASVGEHNLEVAML